MVRVIGNHHFAHSGLITPVMYPHLKKHRKEINGGNTGEKSPSNQRTDNSMYTNQHPCSNIPHLDILNQSDVDAKAGVIDVKTATLAVKAVRCVVGETDVDMEEVDVHISRDEYDDVIMNETDNNCDNSTDGIQCENSFRKRLDSDLTESDSTETPQTSEIAVRKARRRQRNKMSAKAYRARKRTKAQEQAQILETLEAEQRQLVENVNKLQEEKRKFLEYLKTEMNIDMTKGEEGGVNMGVSCES